MPLPLHGARDPRKSCTPCVRMRPATASRAAAAMASAAASRRQPRLMLPAAAAPPPFSLCAPTALIRTGRCKAQQRLQLRHPQWFHTRSWVSAPVRRGRRCGRCPPGSGVMSDLLFLVFPSRVWAYSCMRTHGTICASRSEHWPVASLRTPTSPTRAQQGGRSRTRGRHCHVRLAHRRFGIPAPPTGSAGGCA